MIFPDVIICLIFASGTSSTSVSSDPPIFGFGSPTLRTSGAKNACREFRAGRTTPETGSEVSESEIDYYNVRDNRLKIYERDGYKCRYCDKQLTRFTATLDHVKAIAESGGNGFENLITACLECNSRKNKRRVGDFLAER